MSTSKERIRTDFEAFKRRVSFFEESITNPDVRKDSCESAYEGLYKFTERLRKELNSGVLNNEEKGICHRILDDKFFNGLLELRTVATHVVSETAKKRGGIQIYAPSGQPVTLEFETSAGALFAESNFHLPNPSGWISEISHRQNLSETVARIEKLLHEVSL